VNQQKLKYNTQNKINIVVPYQTGW